MGLFRKDFIPAGGIDFRVQQKILEFLNNAASPEGIAGDEPQTGPVLDNPRSGYSEGRPGYDIGLTVARRILQTRDSLADGVFTNLTQVASVQGMGADKLGDLAHTFGPQYTRKHALTLSAEEWTRFGDAITELIDSGEYASLVAIHANMDHDMHRRMIVDGEVVFSDSGLHRFLPWHRAYLYAFEQALQAIDDRITLPFWDWVNQREIPPEMEEITGAITQPRSPSGGLWLPHESTMNRVLNQDNYEDFTFDLESGPHDGVHVWIGGDMRDVPLAPNDPLFWLHHANVDRYWHYWQQWHPGENPDLDGEDAVMDPWNDLTANSVKHCVDLNYTYQTWPIKISKRILDDM